MKIIAIVNGRSRNRKKVLGALNKLKKHEVDVWITKVAMDTNRLAIEAINAKADLLIVGGGDGTLNNVINECMKSTQKPIPVLAAFPCGSANDFARSLKHKSVVHTINQFIKGEFIDVDVTYIKTTRESRYAINMATCGIGGHIARSVAKRRGWLRPSINYLSATVYWLLFYKATKLKVTVGYFNMKNRFFLAAFGSGKYAGDGLGLCPQAKLNNGNLAVTVIGKVDLGDFIKHVASIRAAKIITGDPRIVYSTAQKIEVEVIKDSIAVETDGEYFITLEEGERLMAKSIPGALRFVAP